MNKYDKIEKIVIHRGGGEATTFYIDSLLPDARKLGPCSRDDIVDTWQKLAIREGNAMFFSGDALNVYKTGGDDHDEI